MDYQGGTAGMDRLTRIAAGRGVRIIEDAAQVFGGEYLGRKLGTIGDIATASLRRINS